MMETFLKAATEIEHPWIADWKQNGKPILGYSCSYVPAELLDAAGILPVRLRGINTDGMEIGDSYFGPYICSFPKCILQLAGKGKYKRFDGVVITPGCDSMRRLYECWEKANEDHPGILPDFFYYLDVPHKTSSHRIDWFKDELEAFKAALEGHFGLKIGLNDLQQSIQVYNKGRQLLRELEALRTRDSVPLSGYEAFAITVAGAVMPRHQFNELLEALLQELQESRKNQHSGKKRLMVAGSISDDLDLIQLIESNKDAVVVADNLCFGSRYQEADISLSDDPLDTLADSYLKATTCPRMFGDYKNRFNSLLGKIKRHKVDGVVLQNIRFCDLHGSENGLMERDLEKEGIPTLKLEREYGPLTETGRIRMRIDAFIEYLNKNL